MATSDYGKRFQESTRGRVVDLLRLKNRTVDELALALNLTDNAVRTHLATLERDGIVRQAGVRRGLGAGKPASIFAIVPAAEARFSNAYVPMLMAVLEELADREDPAALDALMRKVGARMAAQLNVTGDRAARLQTATTLLRELGALVEIEQKQDGVTICGYGCVVGQAVSVHPAACRAIETLLSEVLNEEVHEHCDRNGRPNCRFHVGRNGTDR